jgi:hypothetical protein
MCDDLDEDEFLFPYDDWYDDEYDREPDEPGCGLCYETLWVSARVGASRGRMRRCPSCNPGRIARLISDLKWWWRTRRNPTVVSDEAPF